MPNGGRDGSQLTLCDGRTSFSESDPKSIEITGKIFIELLYFDSLFKMETRSNKE